MAEQGQYGFPAPQWQYQTGMYAPMYNTGTMGISTGAMDPYAGMRFQGQMGVSPQPFQTQQQLGASLGVQKGGVKKGKKTAGKSPAGKAKPKKKPKKPKKKKPKKKPKKNKADLAKKKAAQKKASEAAKQKKLRQAETARKKKEKEREREAAKKKKMLTKTGKKKKERDPNAPKRARTAFNFFLDSFREDYKKDHPDSKGVVDVTRAGSERWKQMTPDEKASFEQMASVAREAYTKAKEEYEAQGGQAKFKLLKGPPRPPTAYFMFLNDFRQEYKQKHPDVKGIKEMSREAGIKWRAMSQQDKEPFESKAKAAKEQYIRLKDMTPEERIRATADCPQGKVYAAFM
uniref:HMG box domain-containing protein n=1 Tax=Chloropicon laureae TaxID=464258 RepID=A0A7S3E0H9_9CHLO|mmetsp:Transcript_11817/g.30606  ORF Transcript_11817/g.30606 Transcript_11817/m.30606 type:complete len:345 (+) Transcript_11817:203-1237(+)